MFVSLMFLPQAGMLLCHDLCIYNSFLQSSLPQIRQPPSLQVFAQHSLLNKSTLTTLQKITSHFPTSIPGTSKLPHLFILPFSHSMHHSTASYEFTYILCLLSTSSCWSIHHFTRAKSLFYSLMILSTWNNAWHKVGQ